MISLWFQFMVSRVDISCDILIVGLGTAGRSALKVLYENSAAYKELKVAVVQDKAGMHGGTCMNKGCLGKSLLFESGQYAWKSKFASSLGFESKVPLPLEYKKIQARNTDIVSDNRALAIEQDANRLYDRGWFFMYGAAHFDSANSVMVGSSRLTFRYAIISTGSAAYIPPSLLGPHVDHRDLISDAVFEWEQVPTHLCVVGSGYIGVEFASIFAALGSNVRLFARSAPLKFLGRNISEATIHRFRSQLGVDVALQEVLSIRKHNNIYMLRTPASDDVACEKVLVATGRRGNVATLQLDIADVRTDADGIVVSKGDLYSQENMRTSNPRIYAVGDVVSHNTRLTPVATTDGKGVAIAILKQLSQNGPEVDPPPFDVNRVQSTVFMVTGPISGFGDLTHNCTSTLAKTTLYRIYSEAFPDVSIPKFTICHSDNHTSGFSMIGEGSAGVTSWFTKLIRNRGTIDEFDSYPFMYPTTLSSVIGAIRSGGNPDEPCCLI